MSNDQEQTIEKAGQVKLSYTAPKLTQYGSVAAMTAGGGTAGADGGMMQAQ